MLYANYMLPVMRTRFRIWPLLAGLLSLACLTGCGGIHAEKGFSPMSLLLPGILQHEPEKPLAPKPAESTDSPNAAVNEEPNTA